MGKKSKAGKRNPKQKEYRRLSEEARQITQELEKEFSKRMLPIAVQEALVIMLNMGCIVLHDDHKFGKKRLIKWVDRVLDTWECVMEKYVSIDELSEELIRMTGCRVALTVDDIEMLKEYGLKGLAHEAALNEEQIEFWHERRAAGWESTVNRYGKEVI